VARIRVYVRQSQRTAPETVVDASGTSIVLPFLRLFALLRIGRRAGDREAARHQQKRRRTVRRQRSTAGSPIHSTESTANSRYPSWAARCSPAAETS